LLGNTPSDGKTATHTWLWIKLQKNKTNSVKTNSEFRLLKKGIITKSWTLDPSTLLKPLMKVNLSNLAL
jgi:hypothetical protein